MRLVQIAVPVPQLDALSYSIPNEFSDFVPGARVLVPLGKRVLTGMVLTRAASRSAIQRFGFRPRIPNPGPVWSWIPPRAANRGLSDPGSRIPDPGSVKPIIDILDHAPLLPPDVLGLTAWVAEYDACGIGEAIATAMPPRSWGGERAVRVSYRFWACAPVDRTGSAACGPGAARRGTARSC